jgi:hypothetical protein
MTISKRIQEHNGITFTMYECRDAETRNGEVALDNCKHVLRKQTLSVTVADNQYKYGDEIIVQAYAPKGSMLSQPMDRVKDTYNRIQVFFPKAEFLEICRKILEGA